MMRTYTRKRPECRVIEDVHKLCRLCLEKPEEAVPIFTEDSDSVCVALALRIMICVGLEIKREDCLPNVICIKCSKELNRYYTFRKKCESSYQKLKAHIVALKKKERIEVLEVKKELSMNGERCHEEIASGVTVQKDPYIEINFTSVGNVNDHIGKVENGEKNIKIDIPKETDINHHLNEVQIESEDMLSPDLSTFLSTILVELGMLVQKHDDLAVADQAPRKLELETGDGCQLTLELEESDEMEEKQDVSLEMEIKADELESNENEEKSVCIKYITVECKQQNQNNM